MYILAGRRIFQKMNADCSYTRKCIDALVAKIKRLNVIQQATCKTPLNQTKKKFACIEKTYSEIACGPT